MTTSRRTRSSEVGDILPPCISTVHTTFSPHTLTRWCLAGLRPFGVSFLFAGWDRHHGFQLYESDPAGTFGGWAATVIGANFQVCMSGLRSVVDEVHAGGADV